MLKKELKLVITFTTTTQAMKMESICKENHVDGRLIPVPKEITAGCGMAWCAKVESKESILSVMKKESLKEEAIFEIMV